HLTTPMIGMVLGSGLGDFCRHLQNPISIPYPDIPHFKKVTVSGHAGRMVFGELKGRHLGVMQGRYHFYEGHSIREVVFPIQVLCALGIEGVVLTNVAGGISPALAPGDLMIIRDQINLTGANPLRGENDERLGPRFPDMSRIYDERAIALLSQGLQKTGQKAYTGIYAALSGPSYETPAEIAMLAILGADAVGMSTAVEAIAARHMGVAVAGISCITNMAAGIQKTPLSHEEVTQNAAKAQDRFEGLLLDIVEQWPEE
ncbi:MAG: purine-nucleoside phosphorylase, partial [Planctomycetes bacterium]|nr:purine-nucleoside phosphorylase [Planctomycetota bacterium]